MTEPTPAHRRQQLALAVALGAWLLALFAVRYGFMEIPAESDPCQRDADGMACRLRALLGLWIHLGIFGVAALILAFASHLPLGRARPALAFSALLAALLALVLYNVNLGAPAAVLAVLALADRGLLLRETA